MRRELWRFAVTNKGLSIFLSCLVLCIPWTAILFYFRAPVGAYVILNAFWVFFSVLAADGSKIRLMNDAIKHMNEKCDPTLLLEETQIMLESKHKDQQAQVFLINRAVALREMGHYGEARAMLESVNVDKYVSFLPANKVVYYNNLADICFLTGDFENAKKWYEKSHRILGDLKEGKQKEKLKEAVGMSFAQIDYMNKNYADAVQKLEKLDKNLMQARVEANYLMGMCYMELNDRDAARSCFEFVLDNGNRLHRVDQAFRILKNMDGRR